MRERNPLERTRHDLERAQPAFCGGIGERPVDVEKPFEISCGKKRRHVAVEHGPFRREAVGTVGRKLVGQIPARHEHAPAPRIGRRLGNAAPERAMRRRRKARQPRAPPRETRRTPRAGRAAAQASRDQARRPPCRFRKRARRACARTRYGGHQLLVVAHDCLRAPAPKRPMSPRAASPVDRQKQSRNAGACGETTTTVSGACAATRGAPPRGRRRAWPGWHAPAQGPPLARRAADAERRKRRRCP